MRSPEIVTTPFAAFKDSHFGLSADGAEQIKKLRTQNLNNEAAIKELQTQLATRADLKELESLRLKCKELQEVADTQAEIIKTLEEGEAGPGANKTTADTETLRRQVQELTARLQKESALQAQVIALESQLTSARAELEVAKVMGGIRRSMSYARSEEASPISESGRKMPELLAPPGQITNASRTSSTAAEELRKLLAQMKAKP